MRVNRPNNLELLITEIRSKFTYLDKTKHSVELHKGMIGLLFTLKAIADQYKYAAFDTFKKQKVFFIRAYNDCVYFWSFFVVESNLYCLFRENTVKLPYEFNARKEKVLDFMFFINELKVTIKKVY